MALIILRIDMSHTPESFCESVYNLKPGLLTNFPGSIFWHRAMDSYSNLKPCLGRMVFRIAERKGQGLNQHSHSPSVIFVLWSEIQGQYASMHLAMMKCPMCSIDID
jgi:hypothetical protein